MNIPLHNIQTHTINKKKTEWRFKYIIAIFVLTSFFFTLYGPQNFSHQDSEITFLVVPRIGSFR